MSIVSEPSLPSRIFTSSAHVLGMKKITPLLQEANIRMNAGPPDALYGTRRISLRMLRGHKVWSIAPKGSFPLQLSAFTEAFPLMKKLSGDDRTIAARKKRSQKGKGEIKNHVLYFHGGAYVLGFLHLHWRFMERFSREADCQIITPDYPLAPEHTVEDVFAMILPLYQELINQACGGSSITIMGDSAGGGLAVALVQELRNRGMELPKRLVLFAPWLDVTMTNPGIAAIDPLDPILNRQGLIDAGLSYAGKLDPRNPWVSPLYGNMEGLPPVSLYAGTRDMLMPDSRLFRDKAEAAGVEMDYHEIKGLVHSGALMLLPEARKIRKELVELMGIEPTTC
jgi:epsilon-lactone hydrolase